MNIDMTEQFCRFVYQNVDEPLFSNVRSLLNQIDPSLISPGLHSLNALVDLEQYAYSSKTVAYAIAWWAHRQKWDKELGWPRYMVDTAAEIIERVFDKHEAAL